MWYGMTMIISVVNAKGGVGKTTTCMYLAAAAAKQRPEWTVSVLDSDPQHSATDWYSLAEAVDDKPSFSLISKIDALDFQYKADVLIVDTAPGNGVDIEKAVSMADLVIVPTEAEPMSMARAKRTLDAAGRNGWLLLTKVRRRTRLWADTREAIRQSGVRCFDTEIPDNMRYKGFATNPSDLGAYSDLWLEIRSILERA